MTDDIRHETLGLTPDGRPPAEQPVWRRAFPIDWPADELRSRREFVTLLLTTSLAFAAGQAWIVAQNALRRAAPAPGELDLGPLAELPVGGVRLFDYPRRGDACVLVRMDEATVVAFGQKCTHLSCPVIPMPSEERFHCPCHHGLFDMRSGRPLAGPPQRPLPRVTLELRAGRIVATGVVGGLT